MKIYVVEMWTGHSWQPTIDMAQSSVLATEKRHEWQARNPDDKFRVAHYLAIRDEKKSTSDYSGNREGYKEAGTNLP